MTQKDLDGWKRALGSGPLATFQFFPELDHLFTARGVPPSPADYAKPGHVAEPVIQAIADWIAAKG